ncbi:MAG: UDP-N-acetylglucosamine 2-epimerase (hydrolyzing) [Bacteroidales bacterium]|nr:MAG: UDP-N-acetylglucosamine 2-epimerase (hydrolyzing) [Bacteroidales bacterium]
MVKIGVLTSSRADFGVYLPLLKAFKIDPEVSFEIIAFGTHLSNLHGRTIEEIFQAGFTVHSTISSILTDDSEEAIASSAAFTSLKFASFWANHKNDFDIVLCIGDRYEMFAAVIAGVPFGIKFAHFYGGDYSNGAIDNIYRDSISHASTVHFTSSQRCAERVKLLKGNIESVDIIGLLSLDELEKQELLSLDEFKSKWLIDLTVPTILVAFHPETVHPEKNIEHVQVVYEVLNAIQRDFQIVITMPNADTFSSKFRKVFEKIKTKFPRKVFLIENFGIQSYFTCMKAALLMIGNTSSGLSEAASFNKYFINIGDRQNGREIGSNVINVDFKKEEIIRRIYSTIDLGQYQGINIYKQSSAVARILTRLKSINH